MDRAERWRRVSDLLYRALDLPAGERTSFVASLVRDEPELRTDVRALWEELRHTSSFLEEPVLEAGPPPPGRGDAFGAYRIVGELGEGGMGVVYLAERDDGQFARRVAIKRVGGACAPSDAQRRFADERQILARLDHPNITRLLDSGFDGNGVPYLVIEHVEGVSITAHCRQHGLAVRDRLSLFLKVCAAVQHAHRNLVIHRDIKPANILVTPTGEPKLLDFGIAKAMAGVPADLTLTTNRALSLDFASPEQVRGEAVTTLGDVYSLGILLYELLADRRAYEVGEHGLAEAVRLVCEWTPPAPSQAAAPDRRAELAGDLDCIVMKAIEKAPMDRYGSVEELGADVSAYLRHLPVKARQPSFGYVARKLVRRHRTAAAVAAVIALLLAASVSTIVWEARRAERQRARAESRFQEVQQLAHYLIFDLHDRVVKMPGSTEVRREMVEHSLTYLDSLAREAKGDARLQLELANAYIKLGDVLGRHATANLGDRVGGMASWERARDLLRDVLRIQPGDTAARQALARLLIDMHTAIQYERGGADDTYLQESQGIWEQLLREQPEDEQSLRGMASVHFAAFIQDMKRDRPGAMAHLEQSRELFERLLAARPEDLDRKRNVALCYKNLAAQSSRDPEAYLRYVQTAARYDRERLVAEPDDPATKLDYSYDLSTLGSYHQERGEHAEALRSFEEALALRRELWRADPANVLVRGRLAYILVLAAQNQVFLGRLDAAAPRVQEALALVRDARDTGVNEARTLIVAHLLAGEIAAAKGADPCSSYRAMTAGIARVSADNLPLGDPGLHALRRRAETRLRTCP